MRRDQKRKTQTNKKTQENNIWTTNKADRRDENKPKEKKWDIKK